MKASDVMNKNVLTVQQGATLEEAARLMLDHRISGLPVVDEDCKVVGVITEGDLMRRAETGTAKRAGRLASFLWPGKLAEEYVHTHGRKVSELLNGNIVAVSPDASLAEVVSLMDARHVKRVLVLEQGRLVGIIARADLLGSLMKLLPAEHAAPAVTDAQIRAQFLKQVDQQSWTAESFTDPVVKDRIVELRGIILNERLRTALRVLAENIPGVRGVRDHLVCIEPVSGMVVSQGEDAQRPAA